MNRIQFRSMKSYVVGGWAVVGALASILVTAGAASAQNGYRYDGNGGHYGASNGIYVNSGTTIPFVLNTWLSSNGSWAGERFNGYVSNPNNDTNNLPDGTRIYGHVTAACPKQGDNTGVLSLAFDRVVLPGGRSASVQAIAATVHGSNFSVRSDGSIVAKSNDTNNAVRDAAIGAAAGAVADVLLNHGHLDFSHILLGGAAGYGVSTVNKSSQNRPSDVTINAGGKVGMTLTDPIDSGRGRYAY